MDSIYPEQYDDIDDFYGEELHDDVEYLDQSLFDVKSLSSTISDCLRPTLIDAYSNLFTLFGLCLLYRVVAVLPKLPAPYHHVVSSLVGLTSLYTFFGVHSLHMVLLNVAGYFLLKVTYVSFKGNQGYVVGPILLSYLTLSEIFTLERSTWEKVRGPQMVSVMKIISFAFDYDYGPGRRSGFLPYAGYMLCPGTAVFGPWTPFTDYLDSFENNKWDFRWIKTVTANLIKSIVCFSLSVCLVEWAIPTTSPWMLLMYRDALLFRVGHYFVSYVSTVSSVLSGFTKIEVTHPLLIEMPHSLVQVVVNWNLPIHRWLKSYVFKTTIPAGTFVAVMTTYVVSSLLHGVNIRLSAVLLSLGVFTYVEHSFRHRLSGVLNACIGPRPCPTPCHKHRHSSSNNLLLHLLKIAFSALTVFHLAYLGSLIDTSGQPVTDHFSKWSQSSYISHWIVLITYLLHLLITYFFR